MRPGNAIQYESILWLFPVVLKIKWIVVGDGDNSAAATSLSLSLSLVGFHGVEHINPPHSRSIPVSSLSLTHSLVGLNITESVPIESLLSAGSFHLLFSWTKIITVF